MKANFNLGLFHQKKMGRVLLGGVESNSKFEVGVSKIQKSVIQGLLNAPPPTAPPVSWHIGVDVPRIRGRGSGILLSTSSILNVVSLDDRF